jgi:tyrosine-protein kinase Etk/Wzc
MNLPIEAIETVPPRPTEKPLASYLDVLVSNRWPIFLFTVLFALFGLVYLLLSPPVYRADIAVQVEEESPTAAKSLLGDVSSIFDVKPAASGEMELIRSRAVVEPAVDHFNLYVQAKPRYFPVIGEWLAKQSSSFQVPEPLRFGGYAWGPEHINVAALDVPDRLLGKRLEITAQPRNAYTVTDPASNKTFTGTVGKDEKFEVPGGAIQIRVDAMDGAVGTRFEARRYSRLAETEALQARMGIFERGRQSGVIGVTLEGINPVLTASILNEIGQEYVRQNVNRKAAQAEKSLAFLDTQLPALKKELDASEVRYNSLRNTRGTIDLGEESKLILQQSTSTQTKLFDLKSRRQELATRFSASHPSIEAIDRQIASLTNELKGMTDRISRVPNLEQDVVRLQRDVAVNSQLYTALLNNAQQLRLVKAGKVGNVRLVDSAAVPETPVRPKPVLVMAVAVLLGAIFGVFVAFVRNALFGGLTDPDEVERFTGLPVLATIPYSDEQERLWKKSRRKNAVAGALLARSNSNTPSIESLRGFRSVLQVSMRQAHNNIVVFTGPVAGVGKSFLSANFAFIQAAIGKRVLLIDADFRKGQLNKYYGTGRENGLFEVLAGTVPLADVRKRNIANGVDFISTGNVTFDPSELLAAPAFGDCLAALSAQYDIVIIDTAPVLASSDAAVVGSHASAVLVVVRSGVNTVGEIHETEKRLVQAGAPVSGVLFNGLRLSYNRFSYRSKYGRYRYSRSDYYSNYN